MLSALCTQLHKAGWRLEIHAIGDKAAREVCCTIAIGVFDTGGQVLDALEAAGVKPEDRPVLTHCQAEAPRPPSA